jgi:hypothetical protein
VYRQTQGKFAATPDSRNGDNAREKGSSAASAGNETVHGIPGSATDTPQKY